MSRSQERNRLRVVVSNADAGPVRYTKFGIEVLKVKPDLEPVLEFCAVPGGPEEKRLSVSIGTSGALGLVVRNRGWGTARELELLLSHPVMEELLPPEARRFAVEVPSGGSVEVGLPVARIEREVFQRVYTAQREQALRSLEKARVADEYLNACRYMDPTLDDSGRQKLREERAQDRHQSWEGKYTLCLPSEEFAPSDGEATARATTPVLPMADLKMYWRCRTEEGQGMGGWRTSMLAGPDRIGVGPGEVESVEGRRSMA